MRLRPLLALRAVPAALVIGALAAGCTPSGNGTPAPSIDTVTPTQTRTQTRTASGTQTVTGTATPTPVSSGPTTARTQPACPWLDQQAVANDVGMRLERITVLRSGGRVVGCRFYALQDSPLHNSERLPGPHQPAVEITTQRYRSARDAHNAFVLTAEAGANPQRARLGPGTVGVCFQIRFYAPDAGRDWACAFSVGVTAVTVRTVVTDPALNVIAVARRTAAALRNPSVRG